jgi:Big-like domain-containing protein
MDVSAKLVVMKDGVENDPVLRLVDMVIADLAVRPARYVGRRARDGDAETFVMQDGEEGRLRLALPDLTSPGSVVAMTRTAQSYLCGELGEPVPRCPLHEHPLALVAVDGGLDWACPAGRWRCALGDYAEDAWPDFDSGQLPGILAGRLTRRDIAGVRSIGVTESDGGKVATFGVSELELTRELVAALRDAAAPLRIEVQERHGLPRRVIAPNDVHGDSVLGALEPPAPDDAAARDAAIRIELAESSARPGCELHFEVVNDGTTSILMGVDYGLEQRQGARWEAIDPGCWFAAVGVIVEPGQRRALRARIPSRTAPGSYRLRKRVRESRSAEARGWGPNADDFHLELTAEFRVTDG